MRDQESGGNAHLALNARKSEATKGDRECIGCSKPIPKTRYPGHLVDCSEVC